MAHELLSLRSRVLAPTCVGFVLVACGGSAAPAPQSTQAPAARLTELDALERDFDVSAEQLAVQLRRRDVEAPREEARQDSAADADKALEQKKQEGAGTAAPAPAPPPAPAANATAPAGADYAAIGGPCDLMCRALSSMQRSAGGICSLAGDQHERCVRARLRLELSERQVREAGCGCSG